MASGKSSSLVLCGNSDSSFKGCMSSLSKITHFRIHLIFLALIVLGALAHFSRDVWNEHKTKVSGNKCALLQSTCRCNCSTDPNATFRMLNPVHMENDTNTYGHWKIYLEQTEYKSFTNLYVLAAPNVTTAVNGGNNTCLNAEVMEYGTEAIEKAYINKCKCDCITGKKTDETTMTNSRFSASCYQKCMSFFVCHPLAMKDSVVKGHDENIAVTVNPVVNINGTYFNSTVNNDTNEGTYFKLKPILRIFTIVVALIFCILSVGIAITILTLWLWETMLLLHQHNNGA